MDRLSLPNKMVTKKKFYEKFMFKINYLKPVVILKRLSEEDISKYSKKFKSDSFERKFPFKKVDEFNIGTNVSLKNNAELTYGTNVSTNNVKTTETDSRQNKPHSDLTLILTRDKRTNTYKSRWKSSELNVKNNKNKKRKNKRKKKLSARKEFIQTTYDNGIGDNKNNKSKQLINENNPMSISNGRLCGIKSEPEYTENVYSNHSFNDKIQTCDIKRMIETESKKIIYENDKKSMKNVGLHSIKLEPEDTENVYSHDSRIGMIKVCDIRTMIDDKLSIEMYNKIFSDNLFDIINYQDYSMQ